MIKHGPISIPFTSICDTPIMVTLAPEHPLARRDSIAISDLRGEDLVVMSQNSLLSAQVMEEFTAASITPRILHRTSQLSFMERLVRAQKAVSFLPSVAAEIFPDLVLRPLEPALVQEIVIAFRPGYAPSERVSAVISHMGSVIRDAARHAPGHEVERSGEVELSTQTERSLEAQ